MFDLTFCGSEELTEVEDCCPHSCDGIKGVNNEENNKDSGCNDLCNPFMSCSTCIGFILPICEIKSTNVTEVQGLIVASEFEHTNSVSFSIWNPPKFS